MNRLLAANATTLEELRRDPAAVLAAAAEESVAILDHDKPAAHLVPAEVYEALLDRLDDAELAGTVRKRQAELDQAVDVTLDDL
jgi:antitoxin StbD